KNERPVKVRPVSRKFLGPLGLVAGFRDAMGGGGWGPIATPTLLSSGRMEPRKIIGTVDTSEFVVALCASLGFLFSLSIAEVPWTVVGALLAGGLFAAPIAAYIVKVLPTRILGTAVGGVILLTNMRTFLSTFGVEGAAAGVAYFVIVGVWVSALAFSFAAIRRDRMVGEGQPA
ncbi:MAG: sulfite exporter TauE/SafE family protein, partial [Rubrobacteraceae bacterium]